MDIASMRKLFDESLNQGKNHPVAYRPVFARIAGSITAGVMLSQALYWTFRTGPDGWFYKKADEWELETALSRHEQQGARRFLRDRGLIEEKLKGVPPTLHFRVHLPAVLRGIELANKGQIGSRKQPTIRQRNIDKAEIQFSTGQQFNFAKKRKSYIEAEITQENTAENTNSTPEGAALKSWLSLKEHVLKDRLDPDEWKLWVRPAYLLKLMAGSTLLIALPPNQRIMEAARERLPLLRELAGYQGYHLTLTRYPDGYERERLKNEYPDFYAAMFGNRSGASRSEDDPRARVEQSSNDP